MRSGWAIGQSLLNGKRAALQAEVGEGTLFMFGPPIDFRAQGHEAYKFLFNGIYHGGREDKTL